jgi:hypothetical protein
MSDPHPPEPRVLTGRVVAELGRPETPEETAARKADNSRKHRQNQTTRNLVLALIASLAIVLFVVLLVPRPDNAAPLTVNWHTLAAQAKDGVSQTLVDPELPAGWTANKAVIRNDGRQNQVWSIGFITPKQQFIGMEQGIEATGSFVTSLLGKARPTGSTVIDGTKWVVYDQRNSGEESNYTYSLVASFPGNRVVLHGSATNDEFATLARVVAGDLQGVAQ